MPAYASVKTGNWDMDSTWADAWVADTVQALNSFRRPTVANGYIYECTARAEDFKTDPVTEPTWPTTIGNTVVDDQVTWTCRDKYPNDVTAGHTFTITAGHTVTYNVSKTVALGAGTVNGILQFSNSMNTKMVGGNVTLIAVSATGEVKAVGGGVIDKAYACEIYSNSTGDGAIYTISIAAGGKWSLYGDPTYYGSDPWTYLAINADNEDTDTTIVTVDDMSSKWASPQNILVHKYDDFKVITTDCSQYTISSISGTIITLTGNHAAQDASHQGIVANLSRNVKIGKSDGSGGPYITTYGTNPTNRPMVRDTNTASGNADFKDIEFLGLYSFSVGMGNTLNGCVFRNCAYPIRQDTNNFRVSLTNFIIATCLVGFVSPKYLQASNFIVAGASTVVISGGMDSTFSAYEIFACNNVSHSNQNCKFMSDGYVYANYIGLGTENANYFGSCIYKMTYGKNSLGALCPNDYDIGWTNHFGIAIFDSPPFFPSSPVHFSRPFYPLHDSMVILSNYPTYGDMSAYHMNGDIAKVLADGLGSGALARPSVDGDGIASGTLIQVSNTQSGLGLATAGVDCLIDHKIWIEDETAVTVTFKVQTTYAGIAAGALKLCVEWISSNTSGITTKSYSTGAVAQRANAADWTQSISVGPFTTKQAGWIRLSMKLYEYESGNAVWIHPKPYIT